MALKSISIAVLAVLAIAGCKKPDDATSRDNASAPTGLLAQAAEKAKAEAPKPALPMPDPDKPLSSYTNMDESGSDAIFLYQAASNMPPDFEMLAAQYSKEYRETSDSFRKQELLTALKPQIEQRIAQAKVSPYAQITLNYNNNLEAYDFQRKGFPVLSFAENTKQETLGDDYDSYKKLNWVNGSQVAFAPIADETVAREVEGMRTRQRYDNPPLLKVYFFAQSVDLNSNVINALVTRVQVTDKSGRVLAEYGPDGSVPVTTKSDQAECTDAAACAAAAAAGF